MTKQEVESEITPGFQYYEGLETLHVCETAPRAPDPADEAHEADVLSDIHEIFGLSAAEIASLQHERPENEDRNDSRFIRGRRDAMYQIVVACIQGGGIDQIAKLAWSEFKNSGSQA